MGDVLAGTGIILGGLLLIMGATGGYAILDQLGIHLPNALETAPNQPRTAGSGQYITGLNKTLPTPGVRAL